MTKSAKRAAIYLGRGPLSWLTTGYERVKQFVLGRKLGAPAVDALVSKIGDQRILSLAVCRTPIYGFIKTILNWLSLGTLNRALKALNLHDKLFHLYLIVTTESHTTFALEKNEVLSVSGKPDARGGECKGVFMGHNRPTVREFIERGVKLVGPQHFYTYRAFNQPGGGNCQDFCSTLLKSNGWLSSELNRFVNQPVDEIAKRIPGFTKAIANAVTDFAARVRALQGQGIKSRPTTRMPRKWIQHALNPAHKGMLRGMAKMQGQLTQRGTIKKSWLTRVAHMGGPVGKRARLALTLRTFRHHRKGGRAAPVSLIPHLRAPHFPYPLHNLPRIGKVRKPWKPFGALFSYKSRFPRSVRKIPRGPRRRVVPSIHQLHPRLGGRFVPIGINPTLAYPGRLGPGRRMGHMPVIAQLTPDVPTRNYGGALAEGQYHAALHQLQSAARTRADYLPGKELDYLRNLDPRCVRPYIHGVRLGHKKGFITGRRGGVWYGVNKVTGTRLQKKAYRKGQYHGAAKTYRHFRRGSTHAAIRKIRRLYNPGGSEVGHGR